VRGQSGRAVSRLGRCSGRVNLGKGDLLIALRAYLDSSGKLENDYMTLAAVAANDEMWAEFEGEWEKILKGHTPQASYVHMREVCHQVKGFDRKLGWNDDNAFGLSNKCLVYMSNLDKLRFRMFYCSVDLKAWRRLRERTYQIPDPIDLCNKFCAEAVLVWYANYYPGVIDPHKDRVKYFFDRHEYFEPPFKARWNAEKDLTEKTGDWSVWQLIDEVGSIEMQTTPGIQAADIVAWGMNREKFAQEGQKAKYMAHIMRQVIPAFSVVWDEDNMKKHFKPLLYLP
jgi:Protein of unknown function (DUF3800)